MRCGFWAALGFFALAFGMAGAQERAPLSFGVVPQQSSSVTLRRWRPVIEAVAAELGRRIDIRVPADIPTFEACLDKGAFDVAYMNPYHYVFFSKRVGYAALAHRVGPGLKGVLVARRDRGLTDLIDLDGATFAFPSKAAFGASLLIRGELSRNGLYFREIYAKSHESTYRAVSLGSVDAGGGVMRTLGRMDQVIHADLAVIYETETYTPHAIAAGPALAPAEREAFRDALLAVTDKAPHVFEQLGVGGFQAPAPDAYADVAALDISEVDAGLDNLGERTCPFD